MKILVTGASGFIGAHVAPVLLAAGHDVVLGGRSPARGDGEAWIRSPELGPSADWRATLDGVEAVVHLAGRAHAGGDRATAETEKIYQRINAEGTRTLARQAARGGVRHFLFLSSCHAVAAEADFRLTEDAIAKPVSAYGRSKLAAEQALKGEFSSATGAYTILRPPLVYGPGNPANFARLMRWVKKGLPLPLAAVRNRRSFIGVQNLAAAILKCLENPAAANRTYFPSDGVDVSSPDLVRALAETAGRPPRLFALPRPAVKFLLGLPGGGSLRKLVGSLYVDDAPLREELGWAPPLTLAEGLRSIWRTESGGR